MTPEVKSNFTSLEFPTAAGFEDGEVGCSIFRWHLRFRVVIPFVSAKLAIKLHSQSSLVVL